MLGPLSFKLRILAKQVSQDYIHSFLGLIAQGNCLFLPRASPPSMEVIASEARKGVPSTLVDSGVLKFPSINVFCLYLS